MNPSIVNPQSKRAMITCEKSAGVYGWYDENERWKELALLWNVRKFDVRRVLGHEMDHIPREGQKVIV